VKGRSKYILTLSVLLSTALFVFKGGYLQELTGHILLFIIQGYVAWFLLYKTGQPFFGYSVTMSMGAYGTIVLTEIYHWPLLASVAAGSLMACLAGLGIFLGTCRARGFYVGMTSFLLAILFPKVINALKPITGGRNGLYFDGVQALIEADTYYVILVFITVAIVGFLFWLITTRTGQILTLVAENDQLAQTVGINTFIYKLAAYGLMGDSYLGPRPVRRGREISAHSIWFDVHFGAGFLARGGWSVAQGNYNQTDPRIVTE
jgi:branched-chain amino acid transport system permease protein